MSKPKKTTAAATTKVTAKATAKADEVATQDQAAAQAAAAPAGENPAGDVVQTVAQNDQPSDASAAAGQAQNAAPQPAIVDSKAGAKRAKEAVVVVLGADGHANAEALQTLLEGAQLPVTLLASNLMPRALTLPQIKGFALGNCGDSPEASSTTLTVQTVEVLHRMAVDVEAICDLNGFAQGVALQVVEAAD